VRENAISSLQAAKQSADYAITRNGDRASRSELPVMRAALLTAQKVFGTPTMPDLGDAKAELMFSAQLVEQIIPFLMQGHVDQAKSAAEAFVRPLNEAKDLI
jgi:hypothetical protein